MTRPIPGGNHENKTNSIDILYIDSWPFLLVPEWQRCDLIRDERDIPLGGHLQRQVEHLGQLGQLGPERELRPRKGQGSQEDSSAASSPETPRHEQQDDRLAAGLPDTSAADASAADQPGTTTPAGDTPGSTSPPLAVSPREAYLLVSPL